jgi:ATP-binding cassette subfamily F protein 3
MKLVGGALAPDRGERRVGTGVTVAYYAQHQVEALDYKKTILEEVAAAAPSIPPERVRSLLGRFLFSGDDVFKPIGVLSGGEKCRVALAKLLANPANLILLDEPTSHLDIPSRDVLGEALEEYGGSIVMISHDRHFIESLARRVVEVGGGRIRSYLGGYLDYLEKKAAEERGAAAAARSAPRGTGDAAAPAVRRTKEEKRREAEARNARYRKLAPVKDEIGRLERELEDMGRRLARLEAQMADPGQYGDGARFAELYREYGALKGVVESKTERWEALTLRLESMEREAAGS